MLLETSMPFVQDEHQQRIYRLMNNITRGLCYTYDMLFDINTWINNVWYNDECNSPPLSWPLERDFVQAPTTHWLTHTVNSMLTMLEMPQSSDWHASMEVSYTHQWHVHISYRAHWWNPSYDISVSLVFHVYKPRKWCFVTQRSKTVFCLLVQVSSGCARPITEQVTWA